MPVTNLDTFFLSTHGAFDFFIKFETKSPEVAVYLIPDRKQEIIGSYLCFLISHIQKSVKFIYNGDVDKKESFVRTANKFEHFWIASSDNYESIELKRENETILSYTFAENTRPVWLLHNDSTFYYTFRGDAEWQLRGNWLFMQNSNFNFGCYVSVSTNSSPSAEPSPSIFYSHDTRHVLRFMLKPFQNVDCMSLFFIKDDISQLEEPYHYTGVQICRHKILFRTRGKNSEITDQQVGYDFISSNATSGFWIQLNKKTMTMSIGYALDDSILFQNNFHLQEVDLGSSSSTNIILRGQGLWHIDVRTHK